ncbi:BMA-SAPS-1 [Dirofilaria immitis]|nr:BMA-SAPS-1 [Dirofilaria immitis]
MFWSSDLAAPLSKLDELLKNDTATLADVLEDDYTIQEIRNGNLQLIKFLTRQEIMSQMIKGALEPEIDETLPLKEQYKKAHLCAEILSINNEELSRALMNNEEACSLLFDFLDNRKLNHVIVNFYMKIFSQIMSRFPDQMLPRMKESQFLLHCMRSMKHSAVMELLYRIVTSLSDIEQQDCMKQWCAENRMVENLCDLLVPEQPPVVHDNVGYLWSELVRILRDMQYAAECKRNDSLLESLQSERNVRHLISRMLPDNVDQHCESVIVNAAAILITLLETNFIPNCPSHQLGMEDRGVQTQWYGGVPVAENELNGTTVWQPDAGHVVETVVAASADRIIGDGSIKLCSDAWCPLMRLLVLVLNTNHMATHQTVLTLFSSLSMSPFKLFLTYVNTRPHLTLFQNLLHRAVAYILYTLSSSPSPLIQYLIKDVDILGHTLAGCETLQADFLHGSAKRMLHGFYMNLASLIKSASENSCNAEFITQFIQGVRRENRGDDTGITPPPTSNIVDTAKIDACDVPEPMVSSAAELMDEYEQYLIPRSLAEDVAISFPCSSHDTDYEIPDITSDCGIAKDFANIGNEDMFDAMCELRIDTSITSKNSRDGWPNVQKSKEMDKRITSSNGVELGPKFPVFWDSTLPVLNSNEAPSDNPETSEGDASKASVSKEERKISKCVIEDKWPQNSSMSSMDFGNWADFTSMKPDDWPPPQSQSEDDAWDEAGDDIILSPTASALSGGIASVIMAGNIKYNSLSSRN